MSSIRDNIVEIGKRLVLAACRAGRNPDEITVMAVSKMFPSSAINEAYDAGMRIFGENRVQEFATKHNDLSTLTGASFHLIGHLQTNKAAKAAEVFDAIDSVDSLKLAQKLNAAAEKLGKTLPILIEINVGGEEAKSGLTIGSTDVDELLRAAPSLPHLAIRGLMTVPPFTDDPEGARPYFQKLRELRDQIAARNLTGVNMSTLSMGMSHDFEVAVEEGSTCIRVGTAIFGARTKH